LVRFNALTGFRCLAACMVFVYHNRKYWRNNLHPEFLRLINEFHIGVSLFFVLSGFLIAYTYADEPMRSGKNYTRYMLLRLARIMPLYWLILTAYYLDPAFGKNQFSLLTYSLFHGFSDNYNLTGIAQAWSLNVEMTFYFFSPLLCLLHRKHILYLIGSLLLLFGVTWSAGNLWHRVNGNPGHYFYPLKFIFEGTFPGRCTEFLAGMLLASALRNQNKKLLEKIPYKTLIGFSGIFITAYCIGLFQPDIYRHGNEHIAGRLLSLFILPFFVMLSLAGLIFEQTWLQRFFSSRILVLLGNASFAFYLVHLSYVNLKIGKQFMLADRNFVLLWLVSILLYLLFEKPVYNWCRKWLK
jgi:peptidoglycan/LPS O-acetylase OafA/YrhL